jgi:hypothetical protein
MDAVYHSLPPVIPILSRFPIDRHQGIEYGWEMFNDVHVSGRGSSCNWTPEKAFMFSGTGYVQILCRWPHCRICSVMLNDFQVSYHSRKGQQQGLGRRSAKMRDILLKDLLHDYMRVAMCEVAGNGLDVSSLCLLNISPYLRAQYHCSESLDTSSRTGGRALRSVSYGTLEVCG